MNIRARWSVLLLFVMFGLVLNAQVTKGSISGVVVDPSGAVLAGATVTAHSVHAGTDLTITTDKSGYFRFNLIPPDQYTVEVQSAGFAKSMLKASVSAGSETSLGQIRVTVGSVENTVEVSAETPLVETSQAQITNTFQTQQISNFASLGDNFGLDRLALFVPGVVSSRSNNFSNTNGASFAVNGLRGRNNDQQIDGQNNNDNSVGGPALFLNNSEFVAEYNIVTSNFGPEYGRNAGSVVNIVTKSGSNVVHGSIYGSENNSILNSLSNYDKRFSGLKKLPRANDEIAGFTIGNPIIHDKLFMFTGFDEEIYSAKSVFTSGTVTPTLAGLATLNGCFGSTPTLQALAKYGPFGIATGNPTAMDAKMYNVTQTVGGSTACANVEMAKVSRTLPVPAHIFDWIERVDYQSGKNTFNARYLFQRNNQFNASGTGSTGYIVNVPDINQQTRLGWTRTLTDRMTNDLAITFGRTNVQFGGNSMGTVPTTDAIGSALASIGTGSGNLGFGPSNTYPQGRIVNTWQVQDNWNYVKGKHTLKAGVNWTYQRSPNVFMPNLNGSYSFTNWGNFAANKPSTISITLGQPVLDFREYDTFLYGGDDWRITQNLTLNFGLTWSYYGQPANLFHDNDLKQQTGSNPYWDPTLSQDVTVFPSIPAPKDGFGPSVGFAYTPHWGGWLTGNGKTVLRGGYRLSHDPPFYNIYLNMASSAPQVLSQSITGATANNLGMPAVPTGPNVRAALASFLVTGVADPRKFNQTKITPDFHADYVNSWSFGIQREITKNLVAEARYVGNQGRDLFQSVNDNPYVRNLVNNFPSLANGVSYCTDTTKPGYGRIDCNQYLVRKRTNTGYSDYNGLQTEVRANNLWNQLTVRSAYTWSKTTDNVSEIFATGSAGNTTAFAQNPLDYGKAEHSISGLDFPGRWAMSFYEQIPFFKEQKGVVGHVLGGWALSGAYQLASGQPYTPIQYYANYLSGGSAANYSDVSFNSWIAGSYDNLRPFIGSNSAPITSIGGYFFDICRYMGYSSTSCNSQATANGITANTLVDFTLWNQNAGTCTNNTCAIKTVQQGDVRYILNTAIAQGVFGTPFGNAGRNSLRDFWTNTADIKIQKITKFNDRWSAEFHATMRNAFNHRNFGSVDPYLEDAGNSGYLNGFGDPTLSSGGARSIYFGATIRF